MGTAIRSGTDRSRHRLELLIILLLLVGHPLISQHFHVEGSVTDQRSGTPVPLASVYVNGTSRGTITGETGAFSLDHLVLPCELIVSHISYEPVRIVLRDTAQLSGLRIGLERRLVLLQEATVIRQQLRNEYLKRFKRWFLGADYSSMGAEIMNDSVLVFEPIENEQFSVETLAPLIVNLPATGYTVKVDLVRFDVRYLEEVSGYHCSILGYYFFDPHEPGSVRDRRMLARSREQAYYNTPAHFCKSLYHNQLKENGYLLTQNCTADEGDPDHTGKAPDFIGSYSTDAYGNELLLLTGFPCRDFGITFNYKSGSRPVDLTYLQSNPMKVEFSGIRFLTDSVYIMPSGRIPTNTVLFSGSIGKKGVAHMLPEDYIPSMQ